MGTRKYIGEFERLVLLAILRLHGNAYGMRIRQEIKERTNRVTSLGAIYTTLERLQAKGLVSSWTGDPIAERGGRAKKFFEVEAAGQQALRQADEMTERMTVPHSLVPHA